MEHVIQESQAWLEQYQTGKRADLHRLQSALGVLEARRTQLTERVSQDNADRGAQSELTRTETAIEELKDQIAAMRDEVRSTMMVKRQELNDTLNSHIGELGNEITSLRAEKERIRTELLPALERQREELIERSRTIETDIHHLNDEINRLNRINIESQDLEFD